MCCLEYSFALYSCMGQQRHRPNRGQCLRQRVLPLPVGWAQPKPNSWCHKMTWSNISVLQAARVDPNSDPVLTRSGKVRVQQDCVLCMVDVGVLRVRLS